MAAPDESQHPPTVTGGVDPTALRVPLGALREAVASVALDGDTCICMLCEGYTRRIAELETALFTAADRFRAAVEMLFTDGQDSEADKVAAYLLEAGNLAYESATPAARGEAQGA